jgi:hypothetical protein
MKESKDQEIKDLKTQLTSYKQNQSSEAEKYKTLADES